MAVEIAKQIPPTLTIVISSVPLSDHLPSYFNMANRLKLVNLVPRFLFKIAATIHLLTPQSAANKKLMKKIIWSGDDRFTRWAMKAVLEWKNSTLPHPFYHIHGTLDRVFPIKRTNPTPGGPPAEPKMDSPCIVSVRPSPKRQQLTC
jgi:hypothetical protein